MRSTLEYETVSLCGDTGQLSITVGLTVVKPSICNRVTHCSENTQPTGGDPPQTDSSVVSRT